MTDDEILAAAERIRFRRLSEKRRTSFRAARTIMIRWDVPFSHFGESYVSITVPREAVEDVIEAHFAPLVAK